MKEFAKLRIPSYFYAIELRTKLTTRRTFVRRRTPVLCENSHNTSFRPFCTIFLHPQLTFLQSPLFFYINYQKNSLQN